MTKVMLDDREVKVGDKLWSCVYGWGEVKNIGGFLTVEFNQTYCSFQDGKKLNNLESRTLFWNEIDMTPPAPPKKLVKKWRWVFETWDGVDYRITDDHYKDSDDFKRQGFTNKLVQKIDSTMIEVEE